VATLKTIKLIIEVRAMAIRLMMTMGKIGATTNTNKEKKHQMCRVGSKQ
jgi:hypothetical protein